MTIDRLKNHFNASIQCKTAAMEILPTIINNAGKLMVDCLTNNHKILSCGNGGSACDALHFATEMLNRFIIERRSLPAIALNADVATMTAIANDYSYQEIFARQLTSLGQKNDILLAITTSGKSQNVNRAIQTAQAQGLNVIALTGHDGGETAKLLSSQDIEIRVPTNITPRIQEVHLLIIHCLCDYIDQHLFSTR